MKKIILLFLISASFSCSKDDNGGCECEHASYATLNPETLFNVYHVPIDCETHQPLHPLEGNEDAVFAGCND